MIVYTIILSAAGVFIAALAILLYLVIRENSRLKFKLLEARAGDKALSPLVDKLKQDLQHAETENADLSKALESVRVLYNKVLRERQELIARNTALVEAMETRPTQPKRTVRKNSTQATEQEKEKGTS